MQRFTVALFALVAILALAFPVIDAKTAGVRRLDTNADRLRRGEGLIPPSSLKRHTPSRVEAAKRHQPSSGSGSPPGGSGSVQCRGGDGKTIGYIGDGGNVKRGSTSGTSCSWSGSTGLISWGNSGSFLGAKRGKSAKSGFSISLSVDLSEEDCAVVWDHDTTTKKLTPSYVDSTTGAKTPCGVTLDNDGALVFHSDVNVAGAVSLYFA
ncbi:unnamed protein product [Peniophora sp. CBMAI 1063]|nr:unnamed protein product [Peniophora sp. CBMAI 1063]